MSIKNIFIILLMFSFSLLASNLSSAEIIDIVFNQSNTKNYTKPHMLSSSNTFAWKPTKRFLNKLPADIVKFFYNLNIDNFKVKILDKLYFDNKMKVAVIISVPYFDCHACSPIILTAVIGVKSKKAIIPLRYLSIEDNNGMPPKTEHIKLTDNISGIFLHSIFIGQSYTIATTTLVGFFNDKVKLIFSTIEAGQISKCNIIQIKYNNQIKSILKNDFDRKRNIIKDDYFNETFQKNGNIVYKSSFCDIFVQKSREALPKFTKCITAFQKIEYMDSSKNDINFNTTCKELYIKQSYKHYDIRRKNEN